MNAHQRAFQQDSQEQYSEWREFVKKERGSYCSNLLLLGNHLLWATCMGCVTWKPYDWLFIKIFTFPETGMEYVEAFEDGSTPYHTIPTILFHHAIPYHTQHTNWEPASPPTYRMNTAISSQPFQPTNYYPTNPRVATPACPYNIQPSSLYLGCTSLFSTLLQVQCCLLPPKCLVHTTVWFV